MNKIITVDLLKEEYLFKKYNQKELNNEILEYLIAESKKYNNITIVINNICNTNVDITNIIYDGISKEYEKIVEESIRNSYIQMTLLLIGIFFICLSKLISENSIWNEIILIIGWVPIWEMVDLELFQDFRNRKRRNNLIKLSKSQITVQKKDNE